MIIAGVLIETAPGAAAEVAVALSGRKDLELHGGDGNCRLAGVWTADSGDELKKKAEVLLEATPEVLGVFPTFVADDANGSPAWAQRLDR